MKQDLFQRVEILGVASCVRVIPIRVNTLGWSKCMFLVTSCYFGCLTFNHIGKQDYNQAAVRQCIDDIPKILISLVAMVE